MAVNSDLARCETESERYDVRRDGKAWLAAKLKTHTSRLVTFQRDDSKGELPATIGCSF
jgi:hypothetical protein